MTAQDSLRVAAVRSGSIQTAANFNECKINVSILLIILLLIELTIYLLLYVFFCVCFISYTRR